MTVTRSDVGSAVGEKIELVEEDREIEVDAPRAECREHGVLVAAVP